MLGSALQGALTLCHCMGSVHIGPLRSRLEASVSAAVLVYEFIPHSLTVS